MPFHPSDPLLPTSCRYIFCKAAKAFSERNWTSAMTTIKIKNNNSYNNSSEYKNTSNNNNHNKKVRRAFHKN